MALTQEWKTPKHNLLFTIAKLPAVAICARRSRNFSKSTPHPFNSAKQIGKSATRTIDRAASGEISVCLEFKSLILMV
jgi:hypothetical protein